MEYARGDLDAAVHVVDDGAFPSRWTCTLCQQSGEKAIKTILVRLAIAFPKSHDLNTLRALLPANSRPTATIAELDLLSSYAVDPRYPGGGLENPDRGHAKRALEIAQRTMDDTERILGEHAARSAD